MQPVGTTDDECLLVKLQHMALLLAVLESKDTSCPEDKHVSAATCFQLICTCLHSLYASEIRLTDTPASSALLLSEQTPPAVGLRLDSVGEVKEHG